MKLFYMSRVYLYNISVILVEILPPDLMAIWHVCCISLTTGLWLETNVIELNLIFDHLPKL